MRKCFTSKNEVFHISEDRLNEGKIPMATAWSDSRDSKNRNCTSTNSSIHNHFGVETRFKNQEITFKRRRYPEAHGMEMVHRHFEISD